MRGMTRKPPIDDDEVVSAQTLARRLGLVVTSVSRLAGYGAVVRSDRGRYLLWGSVRAYLKYHERAAAIRSSPASTARAELLKIQSARAALAYKREQAKLVDVEDVVDRVSALFRIVRAAALAAPARIGAALPSLTRADVNVIDGEMRMVLTELATTPVETIIRELAAVRAEKPARGGKRK